jgi:hypothetical protein
MGATGELTEPVIAFRVRERDEPGLEIRVNFGMFAGRNATQAEIDDLAGSLNDVVDSFTVVAEEVHEFGGSVEASLRQIAIRIAAEDAGDDADLLCERVVARAETWASDCIRSRSELGELGTEL